MVWLPPKAIQAPSKNSSCQVNGLKYQKPEGEAGTFQPKCLAATYRTSEPANVQFGLRTMSHKAGANAPNSRIYSGSTSRLTGLYLKTSAWINSRKGMFMKMATLNWFRSSGS